MYFPSKSYDHRYPKQSHQTYSHKNNTMSGFFSEPFESNLPNNSELCISYKQGYSPQYKSIIFPQYNHITTNNHQNQEMHTDTPLLSKPHTPSLANDTNNECPLWQKDPIQNRVLHLVVASLLEQFGSFLDFYDLDIRYYRPVICRMSLSVGLPDVSS